MQLRKSDYPNVKKDIANWLTIKPDVDLCLEVSNMALATACHIILVCAFVGDLVGYTPELEAKMESLMKFYQVDEVIE